MADLPTHSSPHSTSFDVPLLRQLLVAGCKEISLTVRDKDAAVALRQDINILRKQMRKDGTMPLGAADNAKIGVVWMTFDGNEHPYANDTITPPPPENQIKAWRLTMPLDFTADVKILTDQLLK